MTKVAVVGHVEWVEFVSVPRFPDRGEVLHATGSFTRAAGGGGVAATVLSEHGAEVEFFTALGRDADGEAAAADLREHGVTLHVAWREKPTRRVVTLLEPGGERTIVTIGERLAPEGEDELPWDSLAGFDGVYLTAGDVGALRAARRARMLCATPRAGQALRDPQTTLDALIFSGEDAAETGPAAELTGRARHTVITEGANGGRYEGTSTGRWEVMPAPGEPQDSYGCGDSFAAATTFGLALGEPLKAAVRRGAEWGAIALTRVGAP
jgi:ribokinase